MDSSPISWASGLDLEKYMPEQTINAIDKALDGKVVFLTGATGMLGTALVVKMALDTTIARVYVLVRGGSLRFWTRMRQLLPLALVEAVDACGKIVVLGGDVTHPDFGLRQEQLVSFQSEVTIFIHAASSINLKRDMAKLTKDIVLPSIEAARLAMGCRNLQRFVYVSTAFVNAFLHFQTKDSGLPNECNVEERIYPLQSDAAAESAFDELSTLLKFGSTAQYSCVPHPFAYAYAKHLTERLLQETFDKAGLQHLAMLFRPSIFSPAEREPFAYFEAAGSAPGTSMLAAILASSPGRARFSSNLADPSKATFDEIPVDIVVNRLLVHVARGSHGCVHAVSEPAGRTPFPGTFDLVTKLRPWWWGRPKLRWCGEKSSVDGSCRMSRLWSGLLGCSFLFCEEKTQDIWKTMGEADKAKWPLWASRELGDLSDWSQRACTANTLLQIFLQKRYGRLGSVMATAVKSRKTYTPV